ncbi:MAG: hypothetical protein V3U65_15290 [Granulosicoccaceae bacterium]
MSLIEDQHLICSSKVSFASDTGYTQIQALIGQGVVGNFREPNVMRFGFTPLYINQTDVVSAVDTIEEIIGDKSWDQELFKQRGEVS